jgi:Raf kinase inhibitor-like YbhB/YbcL family protein
LPRLLFKVKGRKKMRNRIVYFSLTIFLILLVSAAMSKDVTNMKGLKISSPAFENNGDIPAKYSCDGMNVNPSLLIEDVPTNVKSLALVVDDPDAPAGTWVHWVVWNIHPDTKEIKENSVPKGAGQGLNDFRQHNYKGPCPPPGTHRYFFKLYALDTILNLSPNSTKADLEGAMKGHVIEQAQIIGLYKRR